METIGHGDEKCHHIVRVPTAQLEERGGSRCDLAAAISGGFLVSQAKTAVSAEVLLIRRRRRKRRRQCTEERGGTCVSGATRNFPLWTSARLVHRAGGRREGQQERVPKVPPLTGVQQNAACESMCVCVCVCAQVALKVYSTRINHCFASAQCYILTASNSAPPPIDALLST